MNVGANLDDARIDSTREQCMKWLVIDSAY